MAYRLLAHGVTDIVFVGKNIRVGTRNNMFTEVKSGVSDDFKHFGIDVNVTVKNAEGGVILKMSTHDEFGDPNANVAPDVNATLRENMDGVLRRADFAFQNLCMMCGLAMMGFPHLDALEMSEAKNTAAGNADSTPTLLN